MGWDDVGYVTSSKYRTQVMKLLAEQPRTPSDLSKETGIEIAHISRALTNLKERELVELLVEEERRKGRYHGLTDEGEETWEIVNQQPTN